MSQAGKRLGEQDGRDGNKSDRSENTVRIDETCRIPAFIRSTHKVMKGTQRPQPTACAHRLLSRFQGRGSSSIVGRLFTRRSFQCLRLINSPLVARHTFCVLSSGFLMKELIASPSVYSTSFCESSLALSCHLLSTHTQIITAALMKLKQQTIHMIHGEYSNRQRFEE